MYTDPKSNIEYRLDVLSGNFKHIPKSDISQAYGVILNDQDQVLLVHNIVTNSWILPGGKIEKGESPKQCLKREIIEEANVEINPYSIRELFFQKVLQKDEDGDYYLESVQVRYFARASKINVFVSDPDGGIDRIQWVDIDKLTTELKWGPTTELIVELLRETFC